MYTRWQSNLIFKQFIIQWIKNVKLFKFKTGMTSFQPGLDALEKVHKHLHSHTRKQRMYAILLSFSSFSFSPSTLRIPFHVVRRQDRCVEQRFIHQHSSQSTSKLTMTFWSHFFLMWRSIQSR